MPRTTSGERKAVNIVNVSARARHHELIIVGLGCVDIKIELSAKPSMRALLLLTRDLLVNVQLRGFLELFATAQGSIGLAFEVVVHFSQSLALAPAAKLVSRCFCVVIQLNGCQPLFEAKLLHPPLRSSVPTEINT
jgi:hypothetical protein